MRQRTAASPAVPSALRVTEWRHSDERVAPPDLAQTHGSVAGQNSSVQSAAGPRAERRSGPTMLAAVRSSTSSLAEATGLPNRPGVTAVGAGRKPGLARSVGISVALGDSSSPALALLLDHPGSERTALGPGVASLAVGRQATRRDRGAA